MIALIPGEVCCAISRCVEGCIFRIFLCSSYYTLACRRGIIGMSFTIGRSLCLVVVKVRGAYTVSSLISYVLLF